jgi:hypothetical protein
MNILKQLNFIKIPVDHFVLYREENEHTIKLLEHIEEKIKLIKVNIKTNSKHTIQNSFEKINKKNNIAKSWRNNITVIKNKDLTELEQKCNEINSLLNKLSPINFEKIKIQILGYLDSDKIKGEILKGFILSTINNIFSKAVLQPTYCPIYVKLLNILDKKFIIKDIINKKCLEYKDIITPDKTRDNTTDNTADNNIDNTIDNSIDNTIDNSIDNTIDNSTKCINKENDLYDIFCNELKNKKFKEGYSQFIGELFNNGMINYKTLEITIQLFFNLLIENLNIDSKSNTVEYLIICLCKLFITIKKNIHHSKKNNLIMEFKQIQKYDLIKRLQFKLLDLIENKV